MPSPLPTHDRAAPDPASAAKGRRDFAGRRWLIVTLRSLHLAAVMPIAAAVLGQVTPSRAAGVVLLLSGLAMWGIELWSNPRHRHELAGWFIPVKLVLVAWMVAQPALAEPLFWLLVVLSSVVSHAPGAFRHWPAPGLGAGQPRRASKASNPG